MKTAQEERKRLDLHFPRVCIHLELKISTLEIWQRIKKWLFLCSILSHSGKKIRKAGCSCNLVYLHLQWQFFAVITWLRYSQGLQSPQGISFPYFKPISVFSFNINIHQTIYPSFWPLMWDCTSMTSLIHNPSLWRLLLRSAV